jgi:hypothetical protein
MQDYFNKIEETKKPEEDKTTEGEIEITQFTPENQDKFQELAKIHKEKIDSREALGYAPRDPNEVL